MQSQPQTHLKTEVFVSPTAPNSPPPLPPDWLALLRASKRISIPSIIHSPTQLTSTVFRNPAASPPPDCLQTTLDAALLITPPQTEFSPPIPEIFQYNELIPDDLVPQSEYQEMPPPLSPSSVTSPRFQSRAEVANLTDSASVVQLPRSSAFQAVRPSSAKSRLFVAKSPRSSVPSRLRSSLPPPPKYVVPPASTSSIAPLPISSTPQILQSSVPLPSVSSGPQTSISLIPSSKHSVAQSTRHSFVQLSGCLDTQSSRSSVYSYQDLQLHNQQDI